MDDQLFTLYWFPNPDVRDEKDVLFQSIYVEEVFREFNENVETNSTEWRFDGDGFHTNINMVWNGEEGGFLITRW